MACWSLLMASNSRPEKDLPEGDMIDGEIYNFPIYREKVMNNSKVSSVCVCGGWGGGGGVQPT